MQCLISSIGILLCLTVTLAIVVGLTVGTMRFVLAPIFGVALDQEVATMVFLSYIILWLSTLAYTMFKEKRA